MKWKTIIIILIICFIPVSVDGVLEHLRHSWYREASYVGEVVDDGTHSFYWTGDHSVTIYGDLGGIGMTADDQFIVTTEYGTLYFVGVGGDIYRGNPGITSICRPGYNTIHLYVADLYGGFVGYGWDKGFYYHIFLSYDKANVSFHSVSGHVYNQSSGLAIQGANVSVDIGEDNYLGTTDVNGYYYVGGIYVMWDDESSYEMNVTASKTGYDSQTRSTILLYNSSYTMDFMLYPTDPPVDSASVRINAFDNSTMQPLNNTYIFINGYAYNTGSTGTVLIEDLDEETEYGYLAYCINYISTDGYVTTGGSDEVISDSVFLDRNFSFSDLYGYIHNAVTGLEVPSANVTVNQNGTITTVMSGFNGLYVVNDLEESGTMNITASKTGFYNTSYILDVSTIDVSYMFNMSIFPFANITYSGTALAGIVYDITTGDGISEAFVRCYNGTWTSTYNTTTEFGVYVFDNLSPSSEYTVEASKVYYKTNNISATTGLEDSLTVYAIGLDPVTMGDGVVIAGYVYNITDSSDLINGASITFDQAGLGTSVSTISNASGFYMISGVENTSYLNITCSHASYQTYRMNFTEEDLEGSEIMYLNIPMYPNGYIPPDIIGSWVAGLAVDGATGQEVPGAAVRCYNGTWTSGYNYTTSSGFFVVDELANSSTYTVEANKYGYLVNTTSTTTPIDLGNGSVVLLIMDRSYVELFGRIYDVTNFTPIETVHVDTLQGLSWINLTTNSTGGFYSNAFVPGVRMDIYVWKDGYFPENFSYTPPVNDRANLTMGLYLVPEDMSHIGPAIFGTVVNAVNLSPIEGVSVHATATTSGNVSTNTTNGLGFFFMQELDQYAYYNIVFEKTGYADTSGSFTTYGLDTLINGGTIYMLPEDYLNSNVTLFGYITDVFTSNKIQDVNVSCSQNGGINYTLTDVNGRYIFYNLSIDQEITVVTNKSGYFEDVHEFTPYENGEYQLDFVLIPTGITEDDLLYQGVNISGYLYDAYINTTRISSAMVGIVQGTTSYNTTTNSSGDYEASGMVKNEYINFYLEHPLYYNYTFPFLPDHNGTYYGNFPMIPNGLIMDDINYSSVDISGFVKNAINLTGIASCNVNTTQNTTWYNTTSNESGGFDIAGYINNEEISMGFNVSGYRDALYTFTPEHNGSYIGEFYMIPDDFAGYNMTGATSAIVGIVYNASTGDAISGASVKCFNMTWVSDYNTTTTSGFFMFDNLEPSSNYGVEASKIGYYNYTNSSVATPDADNYTIVFIPLSTKYPFEIYNGTVVYGFVYDSSTGSTLGGVVVTLSNGTASETNTSTPSGLFVFDCLLPSSLYSLSGAMAGYMNNTVSFNSGILNNYTNQNLPMDPIGSIPHNGTAVFGIVYALPFYESVGNATVQLYNSTWSDTNYSTNNGFFMFDELSALTQYMLAGMKEDYGVDAKSVTTGGSNSTTIAFLYLNKYYTVNVSFIDAGTYAYVTDQVYLTVDSVSSYNTTSGFVNVQVTYGQHTFDVMTASYRSQSTTDAIYSNGNITFYLVGSNTIGGSGTRYEPTTMELQFVDQYFRPLNGIYVTCTAVNTTTGGNWSSLKELYGVQDLTYYNPENSSSGLTDSDGVIIFPSMKPVYYNVMASGTCNGNAVSYSGYLMAMEDRKVIMVHVGAVEPIGRETELTYNVSGYYINSTAYTVNITYHNVGENTSYIRSFVEYRNGTVIDQDTDTNTSNMTYSYTFIPSGGTDYVYGMEVQHNAYDDFTVKKSFTADLPIVIPGMTDERMTWISLGVIVLVGSIFSAYSVRFGAIVIPCIAAFFVGIKWMTAGSGTTIIIASLLVITVLSYIRKSEAKL